MRSSTGIITTFALSIPFLTPSTTTPQAMTVNTPMQAKGAHGAEMNDSKKACGSASPAPPAPETAPR